MLIIVSFVEEIIINLARSISRKQNRIGGFFLAGIIPLLLTGCLVGPNYQPPESDKQLQIETANYDDILYQQANLSQWWDIFNDPLLTSLIDRGVHNNLDLKIALARVKESRAKAGIAASDLYPALDGGGKIEWGKQSENFTNAPTKTGSSYSLGVDAGWEIDLFGRIRRSIEAATADFQATMEERNDLLITIRAEIAGTYLQIRTLQAQYNTAYKNIESQKGMLKLTQVRYKNGLATYLDVAQATQVLANTEAELPVIRIDLAKALTSLSVLLGEPSVTVRQELQHHQPIPLPPDEVAVGIPADQIRQRPDIRKAERQLAAQTARIGVATADLYPTFSLTGTLGFGSLSGSNLLDSNSVAYGVTPAFRWNIFDMGKIRQQIEVEDAKTEQALHTYELTMLEAIKEVEDSLIGYHEQRLRQEALKHSVNASRETLDMSTKLYKDGLSGFQEVLDAQRSLLAGENDLDIARGNTSIQLVGLYKALAGGWLNATHLPD